LHERQIETGVYVLKSAELWCHFAGKQLGAKTSQYTISAQGIGISTLKGKDGDAIFMWNGMRWLSGESNPPKCSALCTTDTGDCKQAPGYHPGSDDFDYWIPLEFDGNGTVQQFRPFVDEFELDL
jgi:hypothetical protein